VKGICFWKSISNVGLVVQLVRISACHAEGREFESRPDRQQKSETLVNTMFARVFLFFGVAHLTRNPYLVDPYQLKVILGKKQFEMNLKI
jgi:hypothetical protein